MGRFDRASTAAATLQTLPEGTLECKPDGSRWHLPSNRRRHSRGRCRSDADCMLAGIPYSRGLFRIPPAWAMGMIEYRARPVWLLRRAATAVVCGLVLCAGRVSTGGEVVVTSGGIVLNGTREADGVTISSNAVLSGNGLVKGTLRVAGGIGPGRAGHAGVLSIADAVRFLPGSSLHCDIVASEEADRVSCASVTGVCTVALTAAPAAIPLDLAIVSSGERADFGGFVLSVACADDWLLTSGATNLLLTHYRGDTDGDTLTDWWENRFFSGRTNAVASQDVDGDGAWNALEHASGTDPTNRASVFSIREVTEASGARIIRWASVRGQTYGVMRSTNGSDAFEVVATGIPASEPRNAYTDTLHAVDQVLYRVRTQLP